MIMSSDALREYEKLLVQLHQEFRAGRHEGPEADKLRDAMETPWDEMTKDEHNLIENLSGDLYFIEIEKQNAMFNEGKTQEEIQKNLVDALKDNRYREALNFLRKLEKFEAIHFYIIGRCWEKLGFAIAADCFYQFVYEYDLNVDRFHDELAVLEVQDS